MAYRSHTLIGGSLAMLVVAPVALGASTPEVTGSGTVALSVADMFDTDFGVSPIPGFGSDSFGLSTADGAEAALDYDFAWDGHKTYTLSVDSFSATGDAVGTAFTGFAFTFQTTTETAFEFSVRHSDTAGPHSDYRAEFAGFVAESAIDIDSPSGLAGNIPVNGAFFASGILPPGIYSFTIDIFQAMFRNTATDGGASASITLRATHAPLPTAGLMGVVTLAAASLAGSLRRPRRN